MAPTRDPLTRPPRVLVVDHEPGAERFERGLLDSRDFQMQMVACGAAVMREVVTDPPDLILLGLNLPDADGLEVLRRVRAHSTIPIIILTARADQESAIRALNDGADDYVTIPFSMPELVARMQAALRRAGDSWPEQPGIVEVDDHLQIDFAEHEVCVAGQAIPLRPTEYRLLELLVRNAGHTLPFETILARVWGPAYRQETQYVHLYVTYLRQKIEPDPPHPRYILTRRGVGYRFRTPANR
jgi:two-component system KDP operon response regulator KdpE